jgi:hypothetical protein
MKRHLLIIGFILAACPLFLNGQAGKCGTRVSDAQVAVEKLISINSVKANESVPLLNVELLVNVYVVLDTLKNPGIAVATIDAALAKLNNAFSAIKLKFHRCNLTYVENYQFNVISTATSDSNLYVQNHIPNAINLYFVSGIYDGGSGSVAGYTFMPGDARDAIFLTKETADGNEIIHQFGHFLGLYHTHEIVFGKELVNDPNCKTNGDRCCDTPADPGISGMIDKDCEYTGSLQDANKQYYVPTTQNMMSLGNDACRCCFTNDQLNRVVYYVTNKKKHLW